MNSNKALTLLELLIVVAILALVLSAVFRVYFKILSTQSQQVSFSRTNLSVPISFQILRKDIEMAGFGLPFNLNGFNYAEAVADASYIPDPSSFNDAPSSSPRAFVVSDDGNALAKNSDVLVIKSSIVSWTAVSSRFGYVYSSGSYQPLSPDLSSSGYFSVLDLSHNLIGYGFTSFPDPGNSIYLAFGLSSTPPRMPFNRVDYYLLRPASNFPLRCNPDSYELYRATINQADGKRNSQPLFDCVADFQVLFGLDSGAGTIQWYTDLSGLSAESIRDVLRLVIVYIVFQNGTKNDLPVFASNRIDIKDPDGNIIKTVDLTTFSDYQYYRWRLACIVALPVNLRPEER